MTELVERQRPAAVDVVLVHASPDERAEGFIRLSRLSQSQRFERGRELARVVAYAALDVVLQEARARRLGPGLVLVHERVVDERHRDGRAEVCEESRRRRAPTRTRRSRVIIRLFLAVSFRTGLFEVCRVNSTD
jgi:hypothetical protein